MYAIALYNPHLTLLFVLGAQTWVRLKICGSSRCSFAVATVRTRLECGRIQSVDSKIAKCEIGPASTRQFGECRLVELDTSTFIVSTTVLDLLSQCHFGRGVKCV